MPYLGDGLFRAFVIATKVLLLAGVPFLAVGYATKVIDVASKISVSSQFISFLLGAALFLPAWLLSSRYLWKPWQFICTLEHEVTHAIVGLPFLLVPRRMWVTASHGGHVKQRWVVRFGSVHCMAPGGCCPALRLISCLLSLTC